MLLLHRALFLQLAWLALQSACLAITRDSEQTALLDTTPTAVRLTSTVPIETHTLVAPTIRPFPTTDPAPPAVTEPPSTRLDLVRRQPCCFNEQGFRVDCATWTGYYYTWGPQGNPYEGGPQCDGNWNGANGDNNGGGSGNGNNGNAQVTVYSGSGSDEGSRLQVSFGIGAALLALAALL